MHVQCFFSYATKHQLEKIVYILISNYTICTMLLVFRRILGAVTILINNIVNYFNANPKIHCVCDNLT